MAALRAPEGKGQHPPSPTTTTQSPFALPGAMAAGIASRYLKPQVCISRPWLLHRREMPPASISGGLAPRRPPSIRQIHRYRASRARRGKSTGTGEGARPAAATSGPQILYLARALGDGVGTV